MKETNNENGVENIRGFRVRKIKHLNKKNTAIVLLALIVSLVFLFIFDTELFNRYPPHIPVNIANFMVRAKLISPKRTSFLTKGANPKLIKFVQYWSVGSMNYYDIVLRVESDSVFSEDKQGRRRFMLDARTVTDQNIKLYFDIENTVVYWDVNMMKMRENMNGAVVNGRCEEDYCPVVNGSRFIKSGDYIEVTWASGLSPNNVLENGFLVGEKLAQQPINKVVVLR